MPKKLLTISIAAYNVEKYIALALDSLVKAEYINELEILVVDDGSIDNTYEIVKEYEKKFPYSIKLVHKSNGGYGSTVNYSISAATSKYFKLLDGDDYVDSEGIDKLVDEIRESDVDIIFNSYNKIYSDKSIKKIDFKNIEYNKDLDISKISINDYISMHAFTYKTEVLRASGLVMKEKLLYTDCYYTAIPLTKVHKVRFLDFPVYNYRIGEQGQSISRKVRLKHIDDIRNISLDLVKNASNSSNVYIDSYDFLCTQVASYCVNYLGTVLMQPASIQSLKLLKDYDNEIKHLSLTIYKKIEVLDGFLPKAIVLLRKTNYIAYWFLSIVRQFI